MHRLLSRHCTSPTLLQRARGLRKLSSLATNNPAVANQLVLLRHGESQWNLENRFTGWVDVPLTQKGEGEALEAGRKLKEEGFHFDVAYTSLLKRAIKSCFLCLEEMDELYIPQVRSWRLNERHCEWCLFDVWL